MGGPILHLSTDFAGLLRSFFVTERTAAADGFLQRLHPTVRLLGVGGFLLAAVATDRVALLAALLGLAVALALGSRVPLATLAARSAAPTAFALVVALPQLVLLPGDSLLRVAGLAVTAAGVEHVAEFVLRVAASVAFASLLILTTPFSALLAAFRSLSLPATAATLLALTYRYLFLFFSELHRMLLARESRSLRPRGRAARWRELGSLSGTFLLRTIERGERVDRAMRARGGARPPTPYRRTRSAGVRDLLFASLAAVALALAVIA